MNLVADLRAEILRTLPHRPAHRSDLEAMETSELLVVYWNWMNRGPPRYRYRVHRSDALGANPLAHTEPYGSSLEHIVALLETGAAVTPHLSRGIKIGFQPQRTPKKNLKRRRDLDLLLNDWGVHHLHLTTVVESDGFVTRSGPLLFAAFRGTNAYLIDILEHQTWASDAIPHTIIRNWPGAGLIHEVKGVLGSRESYSESEKLALRQACIEVPFEVEGRVFQFGPALSTAGTSHLAVRGADRVLATLERFERLLQTHPNHIADTLASAGVKAPVVLDMRFVFLDSGYGVFERNTNFLFRLED
jgi:hypothetical protein